MPGYDFHTTRLYVDAPLKEGIVVALDRGRTHYLITVLRLTAGRRILAFNGRDGEWDATIEGGKRAAALRVGRLMREQTVVGDLHYLFVPLKSARLDYMVQKAVEMGVSRLQPVLTRHGQIGRVNLDRMRTNAIEAAEQCGVLALPDIMPPATLPDVLAAWRPDRHLVFCDEAAATTDPLLALAAVRPGSPLAVLIGPEGGFAEEERTALLELPNVIRLALGPRILRADTAAVAALALVQAAIGDWR